MNVYVVVKSYPDSEPTVALVTKSPSIAKEYMISRSAAGFVDIIWYEDAKGLYGASCGDYSMTLEELV